MVWLTSNCMFSLDSSWNKSPLWFLKIVKLPCFTWTISKFPKMHSGNLYQTTLPNMWLLVLTQTQCWSLTKTCSIKSSPFSECDCTWTCQDASHWLLHVKNGMRRFSLWHFFLVSFLFQISIAGYTYLNKYFWYLVK